MVWQSFLFSGSLALAALRTTHHELVNLLVPPTELKSVQVDYEVFVDEIEEPNSTYTNAIDISSGGVPYRCYSPPSLDGENEGPNVLSWITESALKLRDQARKQELTQSKTLSLLGNCFHLPGAESNWSFSICFGKEIVLYRGARLMANVGRDLFHLGFHEPSLDRVFLNGTIKQMYTEGTSNRSSSILMTCSDTIQDIEFMGTLGNHYEFKMSAPEFCDWRLRSDSRPHIDRLLAFDFGQCFNMTAEWWTYEYCHPDSLLQYHLESNGTVVTPMFLLGGLRIPDRQLESYRPIANPIFPFIRSSFPSIPGKLLAYAAEKVYKNLPVEIIDVPPRLLVSSQASGWAREIAPKGIALYMNEGSPCPEVPTGMRTTRVIFVCPPNMSDGRRRLRPLWVEEVRTCQYDLLVEVPAVCAHPLLRPAVEEFPKTIRCFRKRNNLTEKALDFEGEALALRPPVIKSILETAQGQPQNLVTAASWMPLAAGVQTHVPILKGNQNDRFWKSSAVSVYDLMPFLLETVPGIRNETDSSHAFSVGERVYDHKLRFIGVIVGVLPGASVPFDWIILRQSFWQIRTHREFKTLMGRPIYVVAVEGTSLFALAPEKLIRRP